MSTLAFMFLSSAGTGSGPSRFFTLIYVTAWYAIQVLGGKTINHKVPFYNFKEKHS